MSGYEVEHNIQPPKNDANSQSSHRHMPDLSTFFSRLSEVDTTGPNTPHNAHSVPTPGDVASTYRLLADAYGLMLRDVNPGRSNSNDNATPLEPAQQGLLEQMFESLMSEAEMPPRELKGVPDSFLDELERVPKAKLQKTDACPICAEPFLDDQYPLVVRLPCHKDHIFDYECIRPWLKLNPTCPLDRQVLLKKKPPPPPVDEDDGEYDDMFA